jgi:hypothetical protein
VLFKLSLYTGGFPNLVSSDELYQARV